MIRLEEQISQSGCRALSRDGRWICSPRNPEKEAADWCQRQKVHASDRVLLVLGAGAGYHLLQLLKAFPKASVKVVELDSETTCFAKKNLSEIKDQSRLQWMTQEEAEAIHCQSYDIVLNFRPAWAGFEARYMALYFKLTQNSPSSLARAAEENKMPLTSQVLREKAMNVDFALRDLDFSEIADNSSTPQDAVDEVKFWRTLRELIE